MVFVSARYKLRTFDFLAVKNSSPFSSGSSGSEGEGWLGQSGEEDKLCSSFSGESETTVSGILVKVLCRELFEDSGGLDCFWRLEDRTIFEALVEDSDDFVTAVIE